MSFENPRTFKEGESYHSWEGYDTYKIHIVKVIDEGFDIQVVYRYFGKRKQWWHYAISDHRALDCHIDIALKQKQEANP